MNPKTTYQAAAVIAPGIANHFSAQIASAKQAEHTRHATPPTPAHVETIVDTAFWASLRHEEGHSIKISLAYLSPEQTENPVLFQHRLPLTAAILTKLAPGVERPGIHVGIWAEDDRLYIWGTTRSTPGLCFVVDVSEPGLLVIKHRRLDGFGKFANVAVLKGDQVKVIDEKSTALENCPGYLTSLLGLNPPYTDVSASILVLLAVSMRAHKRGGSLLIVPAGSKTWADSILKPILYAVHPEPTGLSHLVQQKEEVQTQSSWQEAMRREVDALAGLTAVDGATIITDTYELLAFGAKIGRAPGKYPVEEMVLTEPVQGSPEKYMHPTQNGGTRHLSVAQFIHDQHDALGLVASQDGRFSIFSWSEEKQMVHGHLIDTLLL